MNWAPNVGTLGGSERALVDQTMESRIRLQLDELISSGLAGQRLPSERELASVLGVARMTLRRLLDTFIQDGRVERKVGSGTFIAKPLIASQMQLASFSEEMRSRGMKPSSTVIVNETVSVRSDLASTLVVPIDTFATRITRVRRGDDEPIGVETVFIPQWCNFSLSDEELKGSLYELLAQKYGVYVQSARVEISVAKPSTRICELLEISSEDSCMRIDMVDVDQSGRRIMAATCWYRADRYHVRMSTARMQNRVAS